MKLALCYFIFKRLVICLSKIAWHIPFQRDTFFLSENKYFHRNKREKRKIWGMIRWIKNSICSCFTVIKNWCCCFSVAYFPPNLSIFPINLCFEKRLFLQRLWREFQRFAYRLDNSYTNFSGAKLNFIIQLHN